MNRRAFITLLGGAAAATWAPAARAQGDRVRRVAVLALAALNATGRVAVLREELQKLGWREGRDLRLDVRIADDLAALEVAAEEVVKSAPEVIFAFTGPVTRAVQARTRTIPIVFDGGADPIETGLVKNVARPEGNTTGFANSFTTLGGKWVELLKETAPQVTRVAILFNPARSPAGGAIASIKSAATQLGRTTVRAPFRNAAEIESAVEAFAAVPNGALMLAGTPSRPCGIRGGPACGTEASSAAALPDPQGGCADLLRGGPLRPRTRSGVLHRSHPARRETGRLASAVSDPIPTGDQPQDRQGDRVDGSGLNACSCRRGDRMSVSIQRRSFLTLLGAAAASSVSWPLAARAQQDGRVRRIGLLIWLDENDPAAKSDLSAFTQALAGMGWTEGRNVRTDLRWHGSKDTNRIRALAQELVGLQPDVILASGSAIVALQRETQTIPIVFAGVADSVANGIVTRLDRPSGNTTGFAILEATLGGKWLELLSEIAPGLRRAAIMFNPDPDDALPRSIFMPSLATAARSLKVVLIPAPVHNDEEIEIAIRALAREPGGGLVVMPQLFNYVHRAPIILAAARNNVPAIHHESHFARDGGLLSYGNDVTDTFRRAASYVDRILRGAKPAELPVQLPTKFEMVLNLKTAKALGLAVPPSILVRADEVIE